MILVEKRGGLSEGNTYIHTHTHMLHIHAVHTHTFRLDVPTEPWSSPHCRARLTHHSSELSLVGEAHN